MIQHFDPNLAIILYRNARENCTSLPTTSFDLYMQLKPEAIFIFTFRNKIYPRNNNLFLLFSPLFLKRFRNR